MQDVVRSTHQAPEPSTSLAAVREAVLGARNAFDRGVTRSLEWRMAQLEGLARFVKEREDDILAALASDVGKPKLEGYSTEVAYTATEIAETRRHLKGWMKPAKVGTPLLLQPGKSFIRTEPLGLVLIIAPWNYPFGLAVGPLIGALAAGNAAIVKPSEVAPATSALLAKYLPRYVDADAVRVIEGGVPETTELLAQRYDHIFYTGNGTVGQIVMTAAARHLTPVTLELGGKSPVVVDRSAKAVTPA